jgi:hypothetical protein
MTQLPKWPGLVMLGEPVTPLQAMEIIVRTNSALTTNDYDFNEALAQAIGHPQPPAFDANNLRYDRYRYDKYHTKLEDWNKRLGILDLSYLSNQQICSRWIGGLHGWIHWDGTIFAGHYNIGKWPEANEVQNDLEILGSAFPYLKLYGWLLDREISDPEPQPAMEFRLDNGFASINEDVNKTNWVRANQRNFPLIVNPLVAEAIIFAGREEHIPLDKAVEAFSTVAQLMIQKKPFEEPHYE